MDKVKRSQTPLAKTTVKETGSVQSVTNSVKAAGKFKPRPSTAAFGRTASPNIPRLSTPSSNGSLLRKPTDFGNSSKLVTPNNESSPSEPKVSKSVRSAGRSYLPVKVPATRSPPSMSSVTSALHETESTSIHTILLEPTHKKPSSATAVCMVTKLSRQLSTKRREFTKTRQDLILRQSTVLDSYAHIKELEKKMHHCGAVLDEPPLTQMRILDVGHWGGYDIRLLTRNELGGAVEDACGDFGLSVLQELRTRLGRIPAEVKELCDVLLTSYANLPELISAIGDSVKKKQVAISSETERLQEQVNGAVAGLQVKLDRACDIAKIAWTDRGDLISRLEKIKRELHIAQRKLEQAVERESRPVTPKSPPPSPPPTLEQHVLNVEELRQQLKSEQAARDSLKQMLSGAEGTLRVARARISDLERQLRDAQAETESTKRKFKEFELQSKQRESSFESRSKKLSEVTKTSEVTIESLSKQRDVLELRVKELNDQLASEEESKERLLLQEKSRTSTLESRLAEQQAARAHLEALLREAEGRMREAERTAKEQHERSKQILELYEKRRADFLPAKEAAPNERELDLWKELQGTRLALSHAKEDLRQCKRDKDDFLQQLSRIAHKEEKGSIQEKMAEELIEKERQISKLQDTIEIQRSNLTVHEQRVMEYDKQISALKLMVMKLRNYDCNTAALPFQDLQTEILELQMKVAMLEGEKTSLLSECAARDLMLERQERAALQQREALRLRDELVCILEGKTTKSSKQTELSVLGHERSSLVSACASCSVMLERQERAAGLQRQALRLSDELVGILEGNPNASDKREQLQNSASMILVRTTNAAVHSCPALELERARVLKLERVLRAQQEQLEREKLERTKLEKKRAELERSLLQRSDGKEMSRFSLY